VQRTISEESLPREMLDELEEEDEQQSRPEDSVAGLTRNGFDEHTNATNGIRELETPPPSPLSKIAGLIAGVQAPFHISPFKNQQSFGNNGLIQQGWTIVKDSNNAFDGKRCMIFYNCR
jgi:hypothetical protein